AWHKAHVLLKDYGERYALFTPGYLHDSDRLVTNYNYWLSRSEVEATNEAVAARKRFFEGERYRLNGDPADWIVEKYVDKDAFGPPETWTRAKATGWTRFFWDDRFAK